MEILTRIRCYSEILRTYKSYWLTSCLWGTGVFGFTFTIYLRTLLPSVGYSGDTAKFQFIGKIWGLPHPPGYPFYLALNHLFGKLPVGSLAYRINLMSAFFASLTVLLLFFIIRQLIRDSIISFFTALLFGFSRTFWSQALIAEVYTLHTSFLAAVLLLLILWLHTRKRHYFYWACFLYAISFGNHLLMITVLPAFILFVVMSDYTILLSKRTLLLLLIFILLGMSQYGYVFLKLHAPFSEIYQHISSSDSPEALLDRLRHFITFITAKEFRPRMFSFSLEEIFTERIPMSFTLFLQNFFIAGMIIGGLGMLAMLKKSAKVSILLLLIIAGDLVYSLNYDIDDIFVYFIPIYLVFAVFIGYGGKACLVFCRSDRTVFRSIFSTYGEKQRLYLYCRIIVSIGLILFCWEMVSTNFPIVDQSSNTEKEFFTQTVLEQLQEQSVILLPPYPHWSNYYWTMYYLYQLLGEEKQKDSHLPLPQYFPPSRAMKTFPFAPWTFADVETYLQQGLHVYVQEAVELFRENNYLLQEIVFYREENLKDLLQELNDKQLLLMSVKGEATKALDHETIELLQTLGLSHDLLDKSYQSYAAIGVKQSMETFSGVEAFGVGAITLRRTNREKIGTSRYLSPVNIEIQSNGDSEADINRIIINGRNYSPNKDGINLVIFDLQGKKVLRATHFNTHKSLYRQDVTLWKIVGKIEDTAIILVDADRRCSEFWKLQHGMIDLREHSARKYLGIGWLPTKRWGTAARLPAKVVFSLSKPEDMRLSLEFTSGVFSHTQKEPETFQIEINGIPVRRIPMPPGDIEQIFLPVNTLQTGLNLLSLQPISSQAKHQTQFTPIILGLSRITLTPTSAANNAALF